MVDLKFTRKDLFVAFVSVVFLLATMGAIGNRGKRRAKDAVCRANLKRLGAAVGAFTKDHDGVLAGDFAYDWNVALEPYYEHRNLLLCPLASKPQIIVNHSVRGGTYYAWAGGGYICSYGLNQYCSNSPGGGRSWDELWGTIYSAGASKVPLMLDCAMIGGTPQEHDGPPEWDGQIYYSNPADVDEIRSFCLNRHRAAVNSVYMDLSVQKIGLKYLWVQKWSRLWSIPPDPLPSVWNEPQHWMYNFKNP